MWRTRVDRWMQNICHLSFVCGSLNPSVRRQHMCQYTSAPTKRQHNELEHDESSRCIRNMLACRVSGPLENVDLKRILILCRQEPRSIDCGEASSLELWVAGSDCRSIFPLTVERPYDDLSFSVSGSGSNMKPLGWIDTYGVRLEKQAYLSRNLFPRLCMLGTIHWVPASSTEL